MGLRTEVRGLLLQDRGGQLHHFKGRKDRQHSADAEKFDILVKSRLGALHRFYVLDEV